MAYFCSLANFSVSPLNSGLFTAWSKFRMAPDTPQSKLGFSLRAEEVVTRTNCTWTKCVWALSLLFFGLIVARLTVLEMKGTINREQPQILSVSVSMLCSAVLWKKLFIATLRICSLYLVFVFIFYFFKSCPGTLQFESSGEKNPILSLLLIFCFVYIPLNK